MQTHKGNHKKIERENCKKNEKKFEKTKIFCYGTLRDGTRPGSPVPSRCVPGRDGTGPKVGGTMRDEDANSKMCPGTGRKILPGRVPDPSLVPAVLNDVF